MRNIMGIGLMERSSVLLWYTRVDCQGPGSAPKPYARFECGTNFSPCTQLKTRSIECREIDGLEESVHMWAWYVNGVMQLGCTHDRMAVDSKSFFQCKVGATSGICVKSSAMSGMSWKLLLENYRGEG